MKQSTSNQLLKFYPITTSSSISCLFFGLILIITASDAFVGPLLPLSNKINYRLSYPNNNLSQPQTTNNPHRRMTSTILVNEEKSTDRQHPAQVVPVITFTTHENDYFRIQNTGGGGGDGGDGDQRGGGGKGGNNNDGNSDDNNNDDDNLPQSSSTIFHQDNNNREESIRYTIAGISSLALDVTRRTAPPVGDAFLFGLSWLSLLLVKAASAMKNISSSMNYKTCIQWYLQKLDSSPLITKSLTSSFIGVMGDAAAQYFEHFLMNRRQQKQQQQRRPSPPKYNIRRGMAIAIDGLLISGPIMHVGYELFEKILPVSGASGGKSACFAAMAHVIADSIILDSLFVATAMISSGILEGYSLKDDVLPQITREYKTAWKVSMATSSVMSPLEFLFFRFLPVNLRVLAVDVMDIVWDGVVSFMAHRGRGDEQHHHQQQQQQQRVGGNNWEGEDLRPVMG